MSLGEHAEKLSFPVDVACACMRAAGCEPVHCIIRRRGKVYRLWADKRTHRKIISFLQLEQMSLASFVTWLAQRYHYARILFPDPGVFARESRRGGARMSVRGMAEGRAVTDEAKRAVIERLFQLWCRHPEMRLGQLIQTYYRTDITMVEDGEFISYLEAFYQAVGQNEVHG